MGFTSHTGISSWLVGKNSRTWDVEIEKKNQLQNKNGENTQTPGKKNDKKKTPWIWSNFYLVSFHTKVLFLLKSPLDARRLETLFCTPYRTCGHAPLSWKIGLDGLWSNLGNKKMVENIRK